MKTVLHLAAERKKVNFGWLNSYHSFSFGDYYDADKTNFGALRVLNDDTIKAAPVLENTLTIIWKLFPYH